MMLQTGTIKYCLLGFALACAASPAPAQEYPSRPIRMIMPNPSGSGPDIVIRALAESMSKTLGQNVIVEDKAGGAASRRFST